MFLFFVLFNNSSVVVIFVPCETRIHLHDWIDADGKNHWIVFHRRVLWTSSLRQSIEIVSWNRIPSVVRVNRKAQGVPKRKELISRSTAGCIKMHTVLIVCIQSIPALIVYLLLLSTSGRKENCTRRIDRQVGGRDGMTWKGCVSQVFWGRRYLSCLIIIFSFFISYFCVHRPGFFVFIPLDWNQATLE